MRIANEPASQSAPGTHRPIERPLYERPRIRSEDVSVAAVLAVAAGAQVLWNICDRARAGAGNGDDPGPGLARA